MQNIRSKGEGNHQKHAEETPANAALKERINTKQENAKTETMDKNEMTMQLQLEMKM
jgi:hypothetical protein